MTLDEAIKHCEEVAEAEEQKYKEWKDDYPHLKKIDSCIECAEEHRQLAEWLKELKKDREILNGLSIYFQSLVVEAVINQRPCMFDMRDATEAERKSVMRYIANSVFTTGVDFWSIIGEVDTDADSN